MILATNIAETSITVPGVRFVVDTGFVKTRAYSAARGADSLRVVPVSRAQASQRTGRAGASSPPLNGLWADCACAAVSKTGGQTLDKAVGNEDDGGHAEHPSQHHWVHKVHTIAKIPASTQTACLQTRQPTLPVAPDAPSVVKSKGSDNVYAPCCEIMHDTLG